MFRGLKSVLPFRMGFQKGFRKDIREGKLPFYLALGYLIWSLFPHASFRIHEHAGGSGAHTHLSFHDAGLRNGTLVTANPAETEAAAAHQSHREDAATTGGCAAESTVEPRAAHPQSFKPENPRHGHFTEDDNILSAGISISRVLLPSVHPVPVPAPVLSPLLPYSGPATARGPPSRA